jgi:alkylhydroperoxidase family enzyme
MTMEPSNARISLDPPRGLLMRMTERFLRRKYQASLDPVRAMAHHQRVATAYGIFEMQVERWNRLDQGLRDLAEMATAVKIGCSWCVDFGSWVSHLHGTPLEKIEAVPGWRESDLFSPLERLVMEYAEAMTEDPPGVTDELTEALRRHGLDEAQLVELTMMVAVENLRSRFNAAMGLTGQGFKERCEVPQAAVREGTAGRKENA